MQVTTSIVTTVMLCNQVTNLQKILTYKLMVYKASDIYKKDSVALCCAPVK